MEPFTILDVLAPGVAARLRYALESGIPPRYLATITDLYGLQGSPYETTVTLAPGAPEEVRRAWGSWTWRAYFEARSKLQGASRAT